MHRCRHADARRPGGDANLALIRINGANGATAVVAPGAAIEVEALTSNAADERTFFGPGVAPTCAATEVAATEVPEPTAAPEPTAVPEPTVVSEPIAEPEPTATPAPTAVAVPAAIAEPTAVPESTATPEPTAVVEPTAVAEPTAEPEPIAAVDPDDSDPTETDTEVAAAQPVAESGSDGTGIALPLIGVGLVGLVGAGVFALRSRSMA